MSPVVRKWGMRATVSICTVAFSISSLVLVSQVFGADGSMLDVVNPESWLAWMERYGMPLVVLVLIGFVAVRAVRAVWVSFKPIIQQYAEAGLHLLNKQSEFIDKMDERQDTFEKLLSNEVGGHHRTQKILTGLERTTEEINKNVKDIHDKFGHT